MIARVLLDLAARLGGFGTRLFGGIARGLGRLLGGGERFLALFQLGDVAVDAEQPAIVERLVAELDIAAVRSAPFITVAAGRKHALLKLLGQRLGIVDLAEITALDLVAHHVAAGAAGVEEFGRILAPHDVRAVGEAPAEILVEQRDAVGHVVEHGLHDLARRLDVAMRGGGLRLGGVELALALACLRDVAGDAHHAARTAVRPAYHDAVLARPAPRAVAPAKAELDVEPRNLALVERGDHPRVLRPVVGMHHFGERADRPEFREVEHLDQRRGEIHHAGVEIDVVGAGADADRFQRHRIARLQVALVERRHGELPARARLRGLQRKIALLDLGDVADRTHNAFRAAVGPAERDAVLADPAPGPVLGAIARVTDKARRFALQMLDEPAAEIRPVAGMDALFPVVGGLKRRRRKSQNDAQARRVIDVVGFEIPVAQSVVDGLHGERIALFIRGRRADRAVRLPVGGGSFRARGFELAMTLTFLGDVAHRADDSIGASVGAAHRDAVLAAPAPASVGSPVTEVDLEPRRVAPEMRDDRLAVGGTIVGMNSLDDVAGGESRIFRLHPEHVAQLLGEIDLAAFKVGVVNGIVDGLHRERVALFGAGRIAGR